MRIKPSLILFLILLSQNLLAYTFSRGKFGEYPKWPAQYSNIEMYYRADNSSSIPDSMVEDILQTAVESWNNSQYNDLSTSLYPNSVSSFQDGRNEIYFDSTSPYFSGGGVVGITQLIYRSGTGEILEADIALNDNYTFSTNPTDRFYLGNVVTHEMGHVFGIGHSEVQGATMFYLLHPNQHSLASDDKSAMSTLYPGNGGRGKITGRIIGGENRIGIFGAHVQAISRTKGIVAASALADDDGTFVISGLPLEDDYYLYVGPPRYLPAMTSFYQSARTNFCEGGANYRGSFFESCYKDQQGTPYSIHLGYSLSTQYVGNISIQCDLSVPQEVTEKSSMIVNLDQNKPFGSFTGYFASNQFNIANSQWVEFDLRAAGFASDHYLDLKMVSQSLHSTGKYRFHIYKGLNNDLTTADQVVEAEATKSDGSNNLELSAEVQLADDYYRLKIEPVSVTFDQSLYFENFSQFGDQYNFYMLIYSIKKQIGAAMSFYSGTAFSGEDNSYCPSAKNSYTVVSNSTDYEPPKLTSKQESLGVSCATVLDQASNGGDPGAGPRGMVTGFCLIWALSLVLRNRSARKAI